MAYLEGTTRPSTKAAHAVQPTAFHRVLGEAEPEREPLERMEVIQGVWGSTMLHVALSLYLARPLIHNCS